MTEEQIRALLDLAYQHEEHTGQYVQGTYEALYNISGWFPKLREEYASLLNQLKNHRQRKQ